MLHGHQEKLSNVLKLGWMNIGIFLVLKQWWFTYTVGMYYTDEATYTKNDIQYGG